MFPSTTALDEQTHVVAEFVATMVMRMITKIAKMRQLRITMMKTLKGVKTKDKRNDNLCSPRCQFLRSF